MPNTERKQQRERAITKAKIKLKAIQKKSNEKNVEQHRFKKISQK